MAEKKITALVGDYWHKGDMIEEALRKAADTLGGIELKFVAHEQLADSLQDNPDAVVLFKQNPLNAPDEPFDPWMSAAVEAAILAYVERGGRWLAWHTGLAGYDADSPYVGMLRGRFIHHPDMKAITYTRASDGAEVVTLHDEHYFVEVDESGTEVYLRSTSADGESLAGWAHPYGQGKVCCLTPAHTREALLDDGFQALLAERLRLLLA